jgi:site-specific DNA recombinase
MSTIRNGTAASRPQVRCAIYTRKSTEENLQLAFNSLDAQRESAEAFIRSQAHDGWICLADRYDDPGFTGGNMDRPALKRLLADIEAGRVDAVVAYKVDRLSRSLLDFAKLMDVFEKYRVTFVSVTQQFNTATSIGKLTLHLLMSFSEFERELISERTRDKIGAARRKGKWTGGRPLLGYDVDDRTRLVINEDEAARVRAIFALYIEHEALLPVVQELARRGWTNKAWTSKKGRDLGGRAFSKGTLYQLLSNVLFTGKVRYKQELHDGEHEAIVDSDIFGKVQAVLQRNGRSGGALVRNQSGALLKGLLRCTPCRCAMTPAHTSRGVRRYRYYCCTSAQQRGWHTCPSKSVPAGEIERFVVEQIRCIGRDPALVQETFAQATAQATARMAELEAERRVLERDVARWTNEMPLLAEEVGRGTGGSACARLADLQERLRAAERRMAEIHEETLALSREQVTEDEVEQALAGFDPLWEALAPREQARLIHLLVERVDYDGAAQTVSVTFHPSGIQALADEIAARQKEKSA